jgi:hypothetical protein
VTVTSTATGVRRGTDAIAELRQAMYKRQLIGVSLTGPSGSRAEMYMGAYSVPLRFDQTSRGQSNTAEYANPRTVPAGTPVLVVWPGQGANATQCTASFTTDN